MLRRHEELIDAAVPMLVGAVIVTGEVLHGGDAARPWPVAIALAASSVLWARRRWPGWTLLVSGALAALLLHLDRPAGTVAVLAPAVALYSFALTRGRRAQLVGGVAAIAAVLIAELAHSGRPGALQTFGHVLLVAIPLLAAEQVRTHRSYVKALSEQLELAGQTREREADQRAERERMRIARELHDVVAHTLTEINVQAGAAAEQAGPGDARSALERIEQTSHGAIGELRAILGVLRDPGPPDQAPHAPAPGISNIPELIDRARSSGLETRFDVHGEQPALVSDASSLAAYRIVQESLTNARRHAPGAPVRVDLRFDARELTVAIENPASHVSNGADVPMGVGIAGMRERAIALGGRLEAGPMPNGFRVEGRLPYRVRA